MGAMRRNSWIGGWAEESTGFLVKTTVAAARVLSTRERAMALRRFALRQALFKRQNAVGMTVLSASHLLERQWHARRYCFLSLRQNSP
jgi:hypothetical protein